ncbi:hypothetical protein BST95_09550 [Halioglobus japonicus]|nr:hypothetical protein [Halioglobus japonicus]AQA18444.1 hypothetical protein BST95_09550 [Halioglobus japonicus]
MLLVLMSPGSWGEEGGFADEWKLIINFPMLWLPDIEGEIDVDGELINVDTPISDTLHNLDFGFIGEIYARHGPWMLGLRVMHLDTSSGSRIGPVGLLPGLPPLVGEYDVTVESSLFTSDVIGGYTLNDYIALYTGVRRSGLNMRVRTRANEEGSGIVELPGRVTITDEALYDWIGGVALTAPLGDSGKWRAVLEADTLIDGDNDTNY